MPRQPSSRDVTVELEFRGAAWELMGARDREILVSGPAGTGKTVAALYKVHLACLATPDVRCLLARKSGVSLSGSTLVSYRTQVAADAIRLGHVRWYGGSKAEPAQFKYANGSAIVVGGLDEPTKLLSSEYDLALIDESLETDPEDLDTILTRLRNGVLAYQQMIMLTNPGAPTHHLKQRADSGRARILYSRHEDNPRMWKDGDWTQYGRDYLETLGSLTGVRRRRFLLGQWCAMEGLVWDDWDPAIHVTDKWSKKKPPPPEWPRFLSVDFGFTNPATCAWWAEDPDGRLVMFREIYHTRLLVETLGKMILKHNKGEPKPRAIICDHDAEDRATLEKTLGWRTTAAHKSVKDGIDAVAARLQVAGDGKPRLLVCSDTLVERDRHLDGSKKPVRLLDEIPAYVWDSRPIPGGGNTREAPVKADDHGCLVAGTMVATPDGERPIEMVRVGDIVATGAGPRKVLDSAITDPAARITEVALSDGRPLAGTADHPVWVLAHGWRPLGELREGDWLLPFAGSDDVRVVSVASRLVPAPVFNLTVEDVHEFYASGVLTRNCDSLRYAVAYKDLQRRARLRWIA